MQVETRRSYMDEIQHMIRVSRQLRKEGEISEDELFVINKHLGAMKNVLKEQSVVSFNSYAKPKTRVATYG